MSRREQLRGFRAAVVTTDGEALVSLLRAGPWPGHALQLIGDGLQGALAQNIGGARELAERCMTELRERDWEGDQDLVVALTARLDAGPAPLLRSLPVDLDDDDRWLWVVSEGSRAGYRDMELFVAGGRRTRPGRAAHPGVGGSGRVPPFQK